MALPTITELKSVLRIQSTAEDTLLTMLLAQAQALAEGMLGRPITAVERTYVDEAKTLQAYGAVTRLLVPITPVDWGTLVVADVDGTELVEDEDYRLGEQWSGNIDALPGGSFSNGPYTLTAEVGLSADPEYETRIEPILNMAILDLASDLWHRRNPGAVTESTGGGVSTTYQPGVPERVRQTLMPFCLIRA